MFVPPPSGACCDDATGICTDDVLGDECKESGRRYGGDASTCETLAEPCLAPTGACCDDATGICTNDVTEADCTDMAFRYGGNDTTCDSIDPPCLVPMGACCDDATGDCAEGVTGDDCKDMGMRYGGDDSTCESIDPACVAPCTTNAECDDDAICSFDQCTAGKCANTAVVYGDFDSPGGICGPDGEVSLFDIFFVLDGFLKEFAPGCELHNIDIASSTSCIPDGDVNIFDILAVLDAIQEIDPCGCP